MKNDPDNKFPNLELLKEDFINYLYKHRESFTKKDTANTTIAALSNIVLFGIYT